MTRNTLFIASSVRSGSTYIAEEIAYRLQRDAGFQFFGLTKDAFSELTDHSTAGEIKAIYSGLFLDKSGWASSKIHCAGLSLITRESRRDAELHEAFFGAKARWIIVRRRNRISQAVSLAHARKSGAWHVYGESPPAADDAAEIAWKEVEDALRAISLDDAYLDAFEMQLAPERVVNILYEDVIKSGRKAASAMIKLCDLSVELKRDKKKQVAKIVAAGGTAKTELSRGFAAWFTENYHQVSDDMETSSGRE